MAAALIGPSTALADTFSSWTAGPGAALDNTYAGFIDQPTMNATVSSGGFTVSGWFVDRQAQGWAGADDIQVWSGTMDGGGAMLAKAMIAQIRPDVAAALGNPFWAASGFVANIGSMPTGPLTLSVYAHTPGKGWWYEQVQVTVSATAPTTAPASGTSTSPAATGNSLPIAVIEKPKSGENVLTTTNNYTIQGYALDPTATANQGVAGSGVDKVDVYLNARDAPNSSFLGTADLGYSDDAAAQKYGGQFSSAGWRLSFKPTKYKSKDYTLYAYAHSAVSGKEDSSGQYFVIKDHS
ncbi:MAG: hypothetical protein NVSMB2_17220 [Chloroflexota bacterium]